MILLTVSFRSRDEVVERSIRLASFSACCKSDTGGYVNKLAHPLLDFFLPILHDTGLLDWLAVAECASKDGGLCHHALCSEEVHSASSSLLW